MNVLFYKLYLVDDVGTIVSTLESTSIGHFGSVNLYEDTQGNLHIFYKTRPITNPSYGFDGFYKVFNSVGTLITNQTVFQIANYRISASLSKGTDGFVRLVHFSAAGYGLLYEDNRTGNWHCGY